MRYAVRGEPDYFMNQVHTVLNWGHFDRLWCSQLENVKHAVEIQRHWCFLNDYSSSTFFFTAHVIDLRSKFRLRGLATMNIFCRLRHETHCINETNWVFIYLHFATDYGHLAHNNTHLFAFHAIGSLITEQRHYTAPPFTALLRSSWRQLDAALIRPFCISGLMYWAFPAPWSKCLDNVSSPPRTRCLSKAENSPRRPRLPQYFLQKWFAISLRILCFVNVITLTIVINFGTKNCRVIFTKMDLLFERFVKNRELVVFLLATRAETNVF